MSAFTNRQMRRHPEMFGFTLYAPDDGAGDAAAAGGDDAAGGGDGTPAGAVAGETPGEGGDAGEGDAASGGEGSGDAGNDDTPKLDPESQALRDAAIAEGKALGRSELEAELTQKTDESQTQARQEAVKSLRTTRDTALEKLTFNVPNENGIDTPFEVSPAVKAALKPIWDKFDADAEAHYGIQFREDQEADMVSLVPPTDREATQKALDAAADHKTHAQAFGEAYAPHSTYATKSGLDDLVKNSPTAMRELAERIKATQIASRKQGQQDPWDESRIDGEDGGGGDITYKQYLALPETKKAAFNTANPDKFREFLGIKSGG